MKTKNWQLQPMGSAKRVSPYAVLLPVIFTLIQGSLPSLLRAYLSQRAMAEFFVFEMVALCIALSVGIPFVIHRTRAVQSLVGSGWAYRGLLAFVAIAFAYPAVRILIVASKWL